MVAGEDEECVVQLSPLFQRLHDPPNPVVDQGDVGEVVSAHAADPLRRGLAPPYRCRRSLPVHPLHSPPLRRWLGIQLSRITHRIGDLHPIVARQGRSRYIVGIVRTGEPAPQEERFFKVALAQVVHRPLADEVVREELLGVRPHRRTQPLGPVRHVPIIGQRRPLQTVPRQEQVVVVRVRSVEALLVVFVLDDHAVVETAGQANRRGVHLADVDRAVAAVPHVLDPVGLLRCQPGLVALDAVGVHVLPRDDAGARRAAHGPLHKGAAEGDTARRQLIQVGGDHLLVPQAAQTVPALLVRHDQHYIRSCHSISVLLLC